MAEELGERTEQPTSRRLGEARSQGQIAKSQDLASALDMIGAVLLLWILGSVGVAGLAVGRQHHAPVDDQTGHAQQDRQEQGEQDQDLARAFSERTCGIGAAHGQSSSG